MIVLDEYMKKQRKQMHRIFPKDLAGFKQPTSDLLFATMMMMAAEFHKVKFQEHDIVIEQDTGADVKVGVVELITQDYAVVAWEPERAHRTLYPKVYQPNKETFTVYR
jgi:hypothetical protein